MTIPSYYNGRSCRSVPPTLLDSTSAKVEWLHKSVALLVRLVLTRDYLRVHLGMCASDFGHDFIAAKTL